MLTRADMLTFGQGVFCLTSLEIICAGGQFVYVKFDAADLPNMTSCPTMSGHSIKHLSATF